MAEMLATTRRFGVKSSIVRTPAFARGVRKRLNHAQMRHNGRGTAALTMSCECTFAPWVESRQMRALWLGCGPRCGGSGACGALCCGCRFPAFCETFREITTRRIAVRTACCVKHNAWKSLGQATTRRIRACVARCGQKIQATTQRIKSHAARLERIGVLACPRPRPFRPDPSALCPSLLDSPGLGVEHAGKGPPHAWATP